MLGLDIPEDGGANQGKKEYDLTLTITLTLTPTPSPTPTLTPTLAPNTNPSPNPTTLRSRVWVLGLEGFRTLRLAA
jgi:hypothetical protein